MKQILRYSLVAILAMVGLNVNAQEVKTCADVIAGEDGTTFRVKGECTEIKNSTYGNWMLKDATGEILIYGTLDAEGKTKNFSSLGIEVGDIVTVEGPKKTYNTTVELVDVKVIAIEKKSSQEESQEINVTKALELINALENGKTTTEEYNVKGFVISISEISTQYGNATFIMADDKTATTGVTVYRCKGYNNEKIADENIVKVGDEVVVKGKLQKYVKNDVVTPEISSCYLVSINGTTAINTIEADKAQDGVIYNLAGQKVDNSYKGLIIKNGKKMLQK